MGSGRYAKSLSYDQWYKFNVVQRTHFNVIEQMSWVLPLMLFGGLFYPKMITLAGGVILVGRELYNEGYIKYGAASKIREMGAYSVNITEVCMLLGVVSMSVWRRSLR